MTLHNAQSFGEKFLKIKKFCPKSNLISGSFHLLRLMFDDYVLYLVEYVQIEEQMKQFLKLIPNNDPPIFTIFYFNGK
jgi:hypothetical protein